MPIFRSTHVMCVIVDQAGNDSSTLKVDQLRRRPLELFNVGIGACCNDTLTFYRQRLHRGELIIDGNNFSVRKNKVSCLGESCNGPNQGQSSNG